MNFHDFFRRTFGLPSHPSFREDEWQGFEGSPRHHDGEEEGTGWSMEEPWSAEDEFRNVPSSPYGFRIFSGDPMDMHRYFEHQFDEIMKSFRAMQGSLFGGSGLLELPDLNDPSQFRGGDWEFNSSPHPGVDDRTEHANPRDKYLKPNARIQPAIVEPPIAEDNDIDDKVMNDGGLDSVLPRRIFSGKSVISKFVRLPDGRIEEEKKVRSSDGSEEVTVTRKIGDQSHSVTTIKESQTGTTRQTETFVNMDQGELDDFERKWKYSDTKKRSDRPPSQSVGTRDQSGIASFLDWFFK